MMMMTGSIAPVSVDQGGSFGCQHGRLKTQLWFHIDATQGGALYEPHYVLADPPCAHRKSLTRAPQKGFSLRRGGRGSKGCDWFPLTKTRFRTKTGSRLRGNACVVVALRRRGTIAEPLASDGMTRRGRRVSAGFRDLKWPRRRDA